jgi:hypothetical protein
LEVMLASAPAAEADGSVWALLLDNAFTLTLLLVFTAAVVVTLVRRYRRDECLALFDGFHVTFADAKGHALWGDLVVVPNGLEVRFDAAGPAHGGLTKSSALIYADALRAGVGLCRPIDALTPDERTLRAQQIRRSIAPGPVRQLLRALVNFVNALRDALARTLMLVVDSVASSIQVPMPLTEHADEVGASLERAVARAYEPLLERHIGRPVVLRLTSPAAPDHPLELPGYLVEYTQDHLAVLNVVREPFVEHVLEIRGDHQGSGFAVEWMPPRVRIHCTGPDVLLVEQVRTTTRTLEPDCALLRGTHAELSIGDAEACTLRLRSTRRVDVVCPRARGTITHGGELDGPDRTHVLEACGGDVARRRRRTG